MFYRIGQKRRLVSVSRMDNICPPLERRIGRISTLPILIVQFFACLRHGIVGHHGISYVTVPPGQYGALDLNRGHLGSLRHDDGNSVLRDSRTGLGNNKMCRNLPIIMKSI